MCEKILQNRKNSEQIKKMIVDQKIKKVSKKEFDEYIKANYSEDGEFKK